MAERKSASDGQIALFGFLDASRLALTSKRDSKPTIRASALSHPRPKSLSSADESKLLSAAAEAERRFQPQLKPKDALSQG